MLRKHLRRVSAVALPLTVSLICCVRGGYGQSFSSGSNGSDGALNLTTPGTIIFDPKSFSPPLNPAGDNVFNFTTINIASGVTVKLTNKVLSGPVYWLAQGAVTINGTLDLNGEDGTSSTSGTSTRIPPAGGAGGYSGGLGGVSLSPSLPAPQPGNGPGGGPAAVAASATSNARGGNGSFTGSQYLIPLIGGSGGGGGSNGTTGPPPLEGVGGGGGGGGGAILIASSVSITYGGTIRARGGEPSSPSDAAGGGGGSAGAIRLIAPIISDNSPGDTICGRPHGSLLAYNLGIGLVPGNYGVIRLEAFNLTNVDFFDNCQLPAALTSTPFSLALPATTPSLLKVTSINGIPINANPFSFPALHRNPTTYLKG